MKRHFFCLWFLKFYLIFGILLYTSGVQAKSGSTLLPLMSLLPAYFLNDHPGDILQADMNQNSFNVFKRQDNKEISYQQDDLFTSSNNRQKMNHIRVCSPHPFSVYGASIKPSIGTVCHAGASPSDDSKLWRCYNKTGQQTVSVDLYLSETGNETSVSLTTNQAMTIHYAPLLEERFEGRMSSEPLSKFYRDEGVKTFRTIFDQQLVLQEKIEKAKQESLSLMKISVRQVVDELAWQSIHFKFVKGHSMEEEEEFQQNLEEYRSGGGKIRVRLQEQEQENADDIVLKPDTRLQLSPLPPAQGVDFPGTINHLAGGDGGGAQGSSQQKGNEKSSAQSNQSNHADSSGETQSSPNNEALQIANKEALKKYLIDACNHSGDTQSESCFSRAPKGVRLINQSVNKYRKPDGITAGILPDFAGSESGQWLHRKAAASNLAQLERIIRTAGVAINAQSKKSGNTPMIIAAKNNHWDMVEELLKHAPAGSVVVKNKSQRNVLDYFLTQTTCNTLEGTKFIKILTDIMKNVGTDYRFSAPALKKVADTCSSELFDIAQQAIPAGRSHPLMDKNFVESLLQRIAASHSDKSKMVHILLQFRKRKGLELNPNAVTPFGNTPLMLACMNGNIGVVTELLKDDRVRKNINYLNRKKREPYSAYTAAHYWGDIEIMKLLAVAGAYPYNAKKTRAQERAEEQARNASSGGSSFGGLTGGFGHFSSYSGCDSGSCCHDSCE